jgi:hypothetical protein
MQAFLQLHVQSIGPMLTIISMQMLMVSKRNRALQIYAGIVTIFSAYLLVVLRTGDNLH